MKINYEIHLFFYFFRSNLKRPSKVKLPLQPLMPGRPERRVFTQQKALMFQKIEDTLKPQGPDQQLGSSHRFGFGDWFRKIISEKRSFDCLCEGRRLLGDWKRSVTSCTHTITPVHWVTVDLLTATHCFLHNHPIMICL